MEANVMMSKKTLPMTALAAAVTAIGLVACGGGGGGGSSTAAGGGDTTAGGSPSGSIATKSATGVITGFGSVYVNGLRYDLTGASLKADGRAITESQLKVGMVVRIKGRDNGNGSGHAVSLEYDDDIVGPVSSVDVANSRFVVMGQTVIADARTVFDGVALEALAVGNIVEISGHLDAAGNLRATLVELKPGSTRLEVKGRIANLDVAARTFRLGGLLVDFSSAALDGISALSNGLLVEVKAAAAPQNGVLRATVIEHEDVDRLPGEEVEVSGVVSKFVSPQDFTVDGQRVRVDERTEFKYGDVRDLAVDVRLEVEGRIGADGVLIADEVSFEPEGRIEVEASIDAVDATARTITILGRSFKVEPRTAYRDHRANADRYLNLSKLLPGDQVELKAFQAADGSLVAAAIQRKDSRGSTGVSVKGPVTESGTSGFAVVGIAVMIDAGTRFEPTSFSPRVGDIVEVEGRPAGAGGVVATEVERES